MAITSDNAKQVRENVHTDVGVDAMTHSAGGRRLSHEAQILFDRSIIARPLNRPEAAAIEVLNNEYAYYWVNRLAQHGLRYTQFRNMGFENATPQDVELKAGNAIQDSGELRAGDLVLMKIPREAWDSQIKYNMVKALKLSNMRGVFMEGGSTDVFSDDSPRRQTVSEQPFTRSGLIKPFIPDQAEIDAKVGTAKDSERRGGK